MAKKNILIVTTNSFPNGDAGAVRLGSFASIFQSLGYTPIVVGMGETTGFAEKSCDGVRYYSLRYPSGSTFYRVLGRLFYKKHLKKVVKPFADQLDGILIDSGDPSTMSFVKKLAKKNGIMPIYDSVEWYSECEFKNGSRNVIYRYNNALNTKIIDNDYKVIAISSYLEEHFASRGIHVVRVPVIMDMQKIQIGDREKSNSDRIKIVYAGSIGTKDHIAEMVDGISYLGDSEREKLLFSVIGITREQYEEKYGKIKDEVKDSVAFMGRVSRDVVLENLATADFSFLLRPSKERYTKAGFPTKVVEGLASGLPMLCNYSSDLELYLKDKENSIIINECSAEACAEALRRALTLTAEELYSLKLNARKTAEENFDWRLYRNIVEQVLL